MPLSRFRLIHYRPPTLLFPNRSVNKPKCSHKKITNEIMKLHKPEVTCQPRTHKLMSILKEKCIPSIELLPYCHNHSLNLLRYSSFYKIYLPGTSYKLNSHCETKHLQHLSEGKTIYRSYDFGRRSTNIYFSRRK